MKYRGIEIVKQVKGLTQSGMYRELSPKLKGFQIECVLQELVNEAEMNSFERIIISGPTEKRLNEVIEIMLEREEEDARNGGTTFKDEPQWFDQTKPLNVIYIDFKQKIKVA